MTFDAAIARASSAGASIDDVAQLARLALAERTEEQALPPVRAAAKRLRSARLWQWAGLLERAIDRNDLALVSFRKAADLDAGDASIAHGLARVTLEAGLPAIDAYDNALALAPGDGDILIGLAAARFASGRGEAAEAGLQAILDRSPLWLAGHAQLAQLRSVLRGPAKPRHSLDSAIARAPTDPRLWGALFDLHLRSNDFAALIDDCARAREAKIDAGVVLPYEAIAASERGETQNADELFAQLDKAGQAQSIWRLRHQIRAGRLADASKMVDRLLDGERAADVWPYAMTVWQLTGDQRIGWLVDADSMIRTIDLGDRLPPLDRLAALLRDLHLARGEYLDQSVRGGTQTDGPLFSRIEPEIRQMRSAIADAVGAYVDGLPPPKDGHPLLSKRRDRPVRFAGSWSVRLRDAGFHESHVHTHGWISSALYVALPSTIGEEDDRSGWLTIGVPPKALGVSAEPLAEVKPEPGRLVLFPSWVWHGTRPFAQGERLTVAFDVAVPS